MQNYVPGNAVQMRALLLAHFGNLCRLVAIFIKMNTKEIMFLNCAIVITRFGLKCQRIKDSSSGKRRENVMHMYFRICMTFFVYACVQEGYSRLGVSYK